MKRKRKKDHVRWQRGSDWLSRSSPQSLLGGFLFFFSFKNRSVSDLHYGSASISSHCHHSAERRLPQSDPPSVGVIIYRRRESNVGATSREGSFPPPFDDCIPPPARRKSGAFLGKQLITSGDKQKLRLKAVSAAGGPTGARKTDDTRGNMIKKR